MKILYKKLDEALASLPSDVAIYSKMPDFANADEPSRWLVYTFSDSTDLNADNEPLKWVFFVTISICTPERVDIELNRQIISAMLKNGFVYGGGNNVTDDEIYPFKTQYAMDFTIGFPLDLSAEEREDI